MKLKWPILPLLSEISEVSLFAGVVRLYIIISFSVYWSFSPSPECTVIIFPFGECEEWTVSAAQWLDCIKPGKKEPLFWGRADNCRFWFRPVELLLCNQAVISHLQPITKLSIPKQFAYWEIYKSWLTLQGKLHWVCRQRASASSWVPSWAHWGWQGGSGCPEPGGQDQPPLAEQRQLCRLCHFHAPSSVGGVCFLRSWWQTAMMSPLCMLASSPKGFVCWSWAQICMRGTSLPWQLPVLCCGTTLPFSYFLQDSASQRNPRLHGCEESCCLLRGYSCPSGNELCLLQALLHWCNCEGAAAAVLTIPASMECQSISG